MVVEVFTGRGPPVFVALIVVYSIATLFVAARMFCRIFIVRRLYWDDFFIMLSWTLGMAATVIIAVATHRGLGAHAVDIPPENVSYLRKCEYALSILYFPSSGAARISILVFYLYLTKATHKIIHIGSWIALSIIGLASVILFFVSIFQCTPVRAAYGEGSGKCTPILTVFVSTAPINIVTDLAILLLPMPMLTSMQLPLRQKLILISTFGLGIFVTVVAVIRVYYLQQTIYNSSEYNTSAGVEARYVDDYAWNGILAIFWSCMEGYLSIICVNVPTLKPLVIRILPSILVGPKDHDDSFDRNRSYDSAYIPPLTVSRQPSAWANVQAAFPMHDDEMALEYSPPANAHENQQSAMSSNATLDTNYPASSPHVSPRHSPLSGPGTTAPSTAGAHTAWTDTTVGSGLTQARARTQNTVNFNFVNVKEHKSMLDMSVRESWKYCSIVAILFFLWGFSYGLLNALNNIIGTASEVTQAQTLGDNSMYFGGGYLCGPLLLGGRVLRHDERHLRRASVRERQSSTTSDWLSPSSGHITDDDTPGGFKATMITGLLIYGVGAIMFWPCAVLISFPGFMASSFVTGFGLSIVEMGATPFMVLCGPLEYAEMRLLMAQSLQGISSVASGALAQKVFFVSTRYGAVGRNRDILGVQWTYLAITLFCTALVVFFYYVPLPEVCDAELEQVASKLPVDGNKRTRFFGLRLRIVCLALAVISQWLYVASQECVSDFYAELVASWLPNRPKPATEALGTRAFHAYGGVGARNTPDDEGATPGLSLSITNYLLISRAGFAGTRLILSLLLYVCTKYPRRWLPAPRTWLLTCMVFLAIYALLFVCLPPQSNANTIVVPLAFFFTAEGAIYPLIYAIGLRGQGAYTKQAAMWLTTATSGPLFWPFVMYGIMRGGGTVRQAFTLLIGLMTVALVYPLFLACNRDARQLTAPRKSGLTPETTEQDGGENSGQLALGGAGSTSAEMSEVMSGGLFRGSSGNTAQAQEAGVLPTMQL